MNLLSQSGQANGFSRVSDGSVRERSFRHPESSYVFVHDVEGVLDEQRTFDNVDIGIFWASFRVAPDPGHLAPR